MACFDCISSNRRQRRNYTVINNENNSSEGCLNCFLKKLEKFKDHISTLKDNPNWSEGYDYIFSTLPSLIVMMGAIRWSSDNYQDLANQHEIALAVGAYKVIFEGLRMVLHRFQEGVWHFSHWLRDGVSGAVSVMALVEVAFNAQKIAKGVDSVGPPLAAGFMAFAGATLASKMEGDIRYYLSHVIAKIINTVHNRPTPDPRETTTWARLERRYPDLPKKAFANLVEGAGLKVSLYFILLLGFMALAHPSAGQPVHDHMKYSSYSEDFGIALGAYLGANVVSFAIALSIVYLREKFPSNIIAPAMNANQEDV